MLCDISYLWYEFLIKSYRHYTQEQANELMGYDMASKGFSVRYESTKAMPGRQRSSVCRWNHSPKFDMNVPRCGDTKSNPIKHTEIEEQELSEHSSNASVKIQSVRKSTKTMRARISALKLYREKLGAKLQETNKAIRAMKSTVEILKRSQIKTAEVVFALKLDAQLLDAELHELTEHKALREAQLLEKRNAILELRTQLSDCKAQNQSLIAYKAELAMQLDEMTNVYCTKFQDQQKQIQKLQEAQARSKRFKEKLDQMKCKVAKIKAIHESNILINQEIVDLQHRIADLNKYGSYNWADCFKLCMAEILYAVVQHLLPLSPALLPVPLNVSLGGLFRNIFRAK